MCASVCIQDIKILACLEYNFMISVALLRMNTSTTHSCCVTSTPIWMTRHTRWCASRCWRHFCLYHAFMPLQNTVKSMRNWLVPIFEMRFESWRIKFVLSQPLEVVSPGLCVSLSLSPSSLSLCLSTSLEIPPTILMYVFRFLNEYGDCHLSDILNRRS